MTRLPNAGYSTAVYVPLFQNHQIKYLNDTTGRTCNEQQAFNSDGGEQRVCSVERKQRTPAPKDQLGSMAALPRACHGRKTQSLGAKPRAGSGSGSGSRRGSSFSNSTRVVELRCGRFSVGWSVRRGFQFPSHAYVRSLGVAGGAEFQNRMLHERAV